jgi:hypothetical protein
VRPTCLEVPRMRRVDDRGQPGWQSSLARRCGARTAALPVVHIDHIHWQARVIDSHARNVAPVPSVQRARGRPGSSRGCQFRHLATRWSEQTCSSGSTAPSAAALARGGQALAASRPDAAGTARVACPETSAHHVPSSRFIWRTRHKRSARAGSARRRVVLPLLAPAGRTTMWPSSSPRSRPERLTGGQRRAMLPTHARRPPRHTRRYLAPSTCCCGAPTGRSCVPTTRPRR